MYTFLLSQKIKEKGGKKEREKGKDHNFGE